MLKKYIAMAMICLFVLVSLPTVVGDEEIEFPKEDGPYLVYMGGQGLVNAFTSPIMLSKYGATFGPLSFYRYSPDVRFTFILYSSSIFMVNGQLQKFDIDHDYVKIYGLKGYVPGVIRCVFGPFYSEHRQRVCCICDEIDLGNYP